jgi:transmembrane sensor
MNDNQRSERLEQEEIEDQAVQWFVIRRGENARGQQAGFEEWMAASPRHRDAYEWACAHFADAAVLKSSQRHGTPSRLKRGVWAASLVAAFGVAVLLGRPSLDYAYPDGPVATAKSTYRTRHGEIRSFRLAGGSSLILDTASRAVLMSNGSERRIRLNEGKARLTVWRGELPIVLEAGPGAIRVADGVVDVSMANADRIEVDLVSGTGTLQPTLRPAVFFMSPRPINGRAPN